MVRLLPHGDGHRGTSETNTLVQNLKRKIGNAILNGAKEHLTAIEKNKIKLTIELTLIDNIIVTNCCLIFHRFCHRYSFPIKIYRVREKFRALLRI